MGFFKKLFSQVEYEASLMENSIQNQRSNPRPETAPLLEEHVEEEEKEISLVDLNKQTIRNLKFLINNMYDPRDPIRFSGSMNGKKGSAIIEILTDYTPDGEIMSDLTTLIPSLEYKRENPMYQGISFPSYSGKRIYSQRNDRYLYTLRKSEYDKVFGTETKKFIDNQLLKTVYLIDNHPEIELYQTILAKYEDSIYKICLIFKESKKVNNNVVIEPVINKAVTLLRFLVVEILEAEKKVEELRLLEIQRLNEVMLKELEDEIDFVGKSVVQLDDWSINKPAEI